MESWLGSITGHVYANLRQPPVSTLNLAHMIPLSAVWAGPQRDEHFQAPPLFYGKTEGSTPFRFSLHVGDVGHPQVVGPTGAGKSVLLELMAMQFRRYQNNQIFAFDFGGSIRATSLAMSGDWHDLGGNISTSIEDVVSLQPLPGVDTMWTPRLKSEKAACAAHRKHLIFLIHLERARRIELPTLTLARGGRPYCQLRLVSPYPIYCSIFIVLLYAYHLPATLRFSLSCLPRAYPRDMVVFG